MIQIYFKERSDFMKNNSYEKLYEWENLISLFNEFVPKLVNAQTNIREEDVVEYLSNEEKKELNDIDFKNKGRDPSVVAKELIEDVFPYRIKVNHPRYFCFIPGAYSPYSVFGDFLNSLHNPYTAGYNLSEGTVALEKETLRFLGSLIGYDEKKLGGQFVSGGSMANLTAAIIARDDKLQLEEFTKGTIYVSDQTHSSVAKAVHIMGLPNKNIRTIPSDDSFKIDLKKLKSAIQLDIENGYKPFLLVASCGTTNTGTIDPLEELAHISNKYKLWYHIDGAYGASALLSSHKELLQGIELSDSVSWDGHKWLFQTYGCAAIICRDKKKLLNSFNVSPEYLKDVESTEQDFNDWDMGIEMTKPARGMRLWFTLQTVGLDVMREAIDQGFVIAKWIEEEVSKYENLEIISKAQLGAVNFRFFDEKYSKKQLDKINLSLSQRAIDENYSAFLTTKLKEKIVLRFCSNNPLTKKEEIIKIIEDLQLWIKEITL